MIVKFRIASDIHLEFQPSINSIDTSIILPEMEDDANTVLLLAGDIGLVYKAKGLLRTFLKNTAERFHSVVMILGNHEHYGGSVIRTLPKLREMIDAEGVENVHILNNDTITFDDVTIVCSTLWTDMDNHSPLCSMEATQTMTDCRVIRTGTLSKPYDRKFRPHDWIECHVNAKYFITEELALRRGQKTIVMTHHAPSWQSVSEQYIGNVVNGCYVSALDELIMQMEPTLWIHGHVHSSHDYMIGDTRVVCNPFGYHGSSDLNKDFDNQMVVEL